jgi:hypothetical protein
MTATTLSRVIFGNFALNYSDRKDTPYFYVSKADGTLVGDCQYSIEIHNLYEIQRWAILDSLKDVEEITDPEIALDYLRNTLSLPDFDSYIPEAFNQLSEDDKQYCYLICFEFALNKLYA